MYSQTCDGLDRSHFASLRHAPVNCLILWNDEILAVRRRNVLMPTLGYALTIRGISHETGHGPGDGPAVTYVRQNACIATLKRLPNTRSVAAGNDRLCKGHTLQHCH